MPYVESLSGLVNLDWLAFSIELVPCADDTPEQWTLRPPCLCTMVEMSATNTFAKRFIVYAADGSKMLTILTNPISHIINERIAHVQVANAYLYGDLDWVVEMLQEIHPFVMKSLSRVDVCCDFECSPERLSLIQQLATNRAYVQGKKNGSQFHTYRLYSTMERLPHCISWGAKTSEIKWKLYNKTLELTEFDKDGHKFCTKPYIEKQWIASGFDPERVWRLEVSIVMKKKYSIMGKTICFNDVIQPQFFSNLFISLYMKRYVIRRNDGHKDHSNDCRLWLLPSQGCCERLSVQPPTSAREVAEYVPTLRAAMEQLARPEVLANASVKNTWLGCVKATVAAGNLKSYFLKVYGYSVNEINERLALAIVPKIQKPN